ncbi:MAG TPA: helix-turn-helix domain-containing protein [Streptosporangiaceae bacterium]|nr:helix-turn-helix domain-containing protein [Streptosporangiaceae bacterium]
MPITEQASLADMTQKASRGPRSGRQSPPSPGGGTPAQERELRAQGRATKRKLLEAGRDAFDQRGFHAVRVDDVVKAAKTSHGTFYLYFANKEDLFKALATDALHDVEVIAGEFPRVTPDDAGRAALGQWVRRFSDIYATHATVIRILSQADVIGKDFFSDGLQLLFRLSEAMTQGMTGMPSGPAQQALPVQPAQPEHQRAAQGAQAEQGTRGQQRANAEPRAHDEQGAQAAGQGTRVTRDAQAERAPQAEQPAHAELTALACLMMLERVNYLLTVGVKMPRAEMADRITGIIFAAFHQQPDRRPRLRA